jgi:hypothetical protein
MTKYSTVNYQHTNWYEHQDYQKGATYSIPEQHKDKSKHSDERLTKMIFVTSNNKI